MFLKNAIGKDNRILCKEVHYSLFSISAVCNLCRFYRVIVVVQLGKLQMTRIDRGNNKCLYDLMEQYFGQWSIVQTCSENKKE